MKSLLLLLASALSLCASPLTFSWDKSDTDGVTYRLYSQNGTNTVHVDVGITTTAVIDQLSPGTWNFWVTAVSVGGLESSPSAALQVEVPKPPGNFRLLVLESTDELGGTNWSTQKYYRIRTQ